MDTLPGALEKLPQDTDWLQPQDRNRARWDRTKARWDRKLARWDRKSARWDRKFARWGSSHGYSVSGRATLEHLAACPENRVHAKKVKGHNFFTKS